MTTTAHLDYDVLADLAEGLLDKATAVSAQEHLAGCAECRDRAAELAAVSRVLAEAPAPPMPAYLVDRLDAALAAEAAASVTTRRSARRFQLVAAAAAAVVVVGGGVAVANGMLRDPSGSSSADANNASHSGSSTSALGAAPSPGGLRKSAPYAPGTEPQRYTVVRSGTKYTASALAGQVADAIHGRQTQQQMQAPEHAAAGQSPDDCVSGIARGLRPLLVDQASYDGAPATIIVLPARTAGQVAVWVMSPTCAVVQRTQVPR